MRLEPRCTEKPVRTSGSWCSRRSTGKPEVVCSAGRRQAGPAGCPRRPISGGPCRGTVNPSQRPPWRPCGGRDRLHGRPEPYPTSWSRAGLPFRHHTIISLCGGCGRCRKHSPTVNVVAIPLRAPRSGRNRSLDLMGGCGRRGRRLSASMNALRSCPSMDVRRAERQGITLLHITQPLAGSPTHDASLQRGSTSPCCALFAPAAAALTSPR